MSNTDRTPLRKAAMRKRCKLLMEPPKSGDPGYELFVADPSAYQDAYGCPCNEKKDCHFKAELPRGVL